MNTLNNFHKIRRKTYTASELLRCNRLALVAVMGVSAGCSRTELVVGTVDVNDASRDVPSAVIEDSAAVVDDLPEQDVDAVDVVVLPRCRNNESCNDGVECTIDECNFADGMCVHRLDLSRCGCDPTCRLVTTGRGGMMFSDEGRAGAEYDPMVDGLVVRADSRRTDILWVPNTGESTVSKWDAMGEREIGRYRVGLPQGECPGQCCYTPGCNQVSRIVVDSRGNAFAANRGFSMQGSVTKLIAERADCVDRNGNGFIDTSTGPMDVRPFGGDECVAWTANVGPVDAVLRSITIDRGDAQFPEGSVWVGGCVNTGGLIGNAGLFRLNPRTGAQIGHIPLEQCAYGMVTTVDDTIWVHVLGNGIIPVNHVTGTVGQLVAPPRGSTYGITTDADGRLWLSRPSSTPVGFDPLRRVWTEVMMPTVEGSGSPNSLGITVDANNHVWVASATAAFEWSAREFVSDRDIPASAVRAYVFGAVPNFAMFPTAIGADRAGSIWLASNRVGAPLIKLDPMTSRARAFTGPNQVYTYTDFTGAVRRLVIASGSYTEHYDTGCTPDFADFHWSATIPAGTSIQFVLRTATTEAGLAAATPVLLATAPTAQPIDVTAQLLAAAVVPGRYATIAATLIPTNSPVRSPVLESMTLSWRCQ